MSRRKVIHQGDVYWLNPNPIAGREMKDRHRFVVITQQAINALGLVMMVPITSGGKAARAMGITVPITGHDTTGVAVCNQVRTFDIEARIKNGSAKYIERFDTATTAEIVNRVVSVIDPADS